MKKFSIVSIISAFFVLFLCITCMAGTKIHEDFGKTGEFSKHDRDKDGDVDGMDLIIQRMHIEFSYGIDADYGYVINLHTDNIPKKSYIWLYLDGEYVGKVRPCMAKKKRSKVSARLIHSGWCIATIDIPGPGNYAMTAVVKNKRKKIISQKEKLVTVPEINYTPSPAQEDMFLAFYHYSNNSPQVALLGTNLTSSKATVSVNEKKIGTVFSSMIVSTGALLDKKTCKGIVRFKRPGSYDVKFDFDNGISIERSYTVPHYEMWFSGAECNDDLVQLTYNFIPLFVDIDPENDYLVIDLSKDSFTISRDLEFSKNQNKYGFYTITVDLSLEEVELLSGEITLDVSLVQKNAITSENFRVWNSIPNCNPGELDVYLSTDEPGIRDSHLTAGKISGYVGVIELDAKGENIFAKDIHIQAMSDNSVIIDNIQVLQLTAGDGVTVIAETDTFYQLNDGNVVYIFEDVDYEVETEGTKKIYLRVLNNEIGDGSDQIGTSGATTTFSIYDVTAFGKESGNEITLVGVSEPEPNGESEFDNDNMTNSVINVGVAVAAIKDDISNDNLNGGTNTIARFKFIIDSGNNRDWHGNEAMFFPRLLKLTTYTDVVGIDSLEFYWESDSANKVVVPYPAPEFVDLSALNGISEQDVLVVRSIHTDVGGMEKYIETSIVNLKTDIIWNDGTGGPDLTGIHLDYNSVRSTTLKN